MNDFEFAFPGFEFVLKELVGENVTLYQGAFKGLFIAEEIIGGSQVGREEITAVKVLRWDSGVGEGAKLLCYAAPEIEEVGIGRWGRGP